MELLIVNFNLNGITEAEYAAVCDQIAPAFAAVPGLVTKVWLADSTAGVYGGVYTFETGVMLEAFLASDLFAQVGGMKELSGISVHRFGVLVAPTGVTRGLVGASV
jgi:Putative mono-oxygenase ydhR